MNKLFVVGIMSLLLVSCVYAVGVRYSEPTKEDGSPIEWKEAKQPTTKTLISREEYNKIFEDYRVGILTKKEASDKLKDSRW